MTTDDAIGRPVKFCSLAGEPCWTTVVGVVGNVHQYDLEAGPNRRFLWCRWLGALYRRPNHIGSQLRGPGRDWRNP